MSYTPREIAVRLFLTCWLIYALHFATNTVREVYLALAIGDHLSFRVDEYAGLHPDLFETPGRGWHIGNNPGASMLGAIPYAIARPLVSKLVERVNARRAASGTSAPEYQSPWPLARRFYQEAWRRGLDVKFGLAAFVMQAFCMAPLSAAAVALMFWLLRFYFADDRKALVFALLYAFATPVFFRTGYLNQNMIAGHFALAGFAALTMGHSRFAAGIAGACAGATILMDYSGMVVLMSLGALCAWTRRRHLPVFLLAAVPPVLLLWFYQWASFGNPFLPGQHYMPPVQWIDHGYQGVSGPQAELAWMLAFDYRFGLFVSCPLLLAAFAYPWATARITRPVYWFLIAFFMLFWLFFASVNYTRLQFNTGVRYMAPMIPVLYVPAAMALSALRPRFLYFFAIPCLALSWCLAMYRDVERGAGVLEPVLQIMLGGFQLPALATLARLQWVPDVSPLPLFALTGAVTYGIWRRR